MRALLILAFAIVISNVTSFSPPNCGMPRQKPGNRVRRLLGGYDTDVGTQPWIVMLRQYLTANMCTGVLITDRHVVTAASCFATEDCQISLPFLLEMTVCHGASDLRQQCRGPGETEVEVANTSLFNEYIINGCRTEDDLVIVTLKRPIPNAVPICLPTSDNGKLAYKTRNPTELYLAGYKYGNIRFRSGKSGRRTQCSEEGPFICVNPNSHNGVAFCWGEVGGPMTEIHENRHVLVGINLQSNGDCTTEGFDGDMQLAIEVQPQLNKILSVIE